MVPTEGLGGVGGTAFRGWKMANICKQAALRAYHGLRAHGRDETAAFDAAVAVYRFYHPETPAVDSVDLVDGWIEESGADQS